MHGKESSWLIMIFLSNSFTVCNFAHRPWVKQNNRNKFRRLNLSLSSALSAAKLRRCCILFLPKEGDQSWPQNVVLNFKTDDGRNQTSEELFQLFFSNTCTCISPAPYSKILLRLVIDKSLQVKFTFLWFVCLFALRSTWDVSNSGTLRRVPYYSAIEIITCYCTL